MPYDITRPEIGDIVVFQCEDKGPEFWTYRRNANRPRATPNPKPQPTYAIVSKALGRMPRESMAVACNRIVDAGLDEDGKDEDRLVRWRAARVLLLGEPSPREALFTARRIIEESDRLLEESDEEDESDSSYRYIHAEEDDDDVFEEDGEHKNPAARQP